MAASEAQNQEQQFAASFVVALLDGARKHRATVAGFRRGAHESRHGSHFAAVIRSTSGCAS